MGIIELSILWVFIAEILLNSFTFRYLYWKEKLNVLDAFVIVVSIAFVILELLITNQFIVGFFKIRGLFRFLRIFLLLRKLNDMKNRKTLKKT
jgi:hypothetical protein